MNEMIHIFGDSHAFMFRNIEGCSIHYMGAVTMHRIGRDGIDIKNYRVNQNDIAVFAFGEIDVRCHIGIQRDKHKRDVEEIIHTLADKFVQAILKNKDQFMSIHSIICSVTPPTNISFNPGYPFYGTLEDRIGLARNLNNILQNKCALNNIEFLDIYDYYSLDNGELDPAVSDGNVHIDSRYNEHIKRCLFDYIDKLDLGEDTSSNKKLNGIKEIINLLQVEKFVEARVEIENALAQYPNNTELLNFKGELKLHQGELEEAKEIFSDITNRWPNNIQALNNLAVVMFHELDYDTAINLLEKVLKLDPFCTEAITNLKFIRELNKAL